MTAEVKKIANVQKTDAVVVGGRSSIRQSERK